MDEEADDLVPIPASFWGNFDQEGMIAEAQVGPMAWRRLYNDRQTYEDWLKGDFAVWFHDGREEQVSGVMLNREQVMRAFPAPSKH